AAAVRPAHPRPRELRRPGVARRHRVGAAAVSGRVAFVYDHLWPHTIGGAERWYAAIAARLAEEGEAVTLVSRTFPAMGAHAPAGVEVVGLGRGGRLRFPLALAWHLLRHGRRYRVVHVCSFPSGLS